MLSPASIIIVDTCTDAKVQFDIGPKVPSVPESSPRFYLSSNKLLMMQHCYTAIETEMLKAQIPISTMTGTF